MLKKPKIIPETDNKNSSSEVNYINPMIMLKKQLQKRLINPRVTSAKLHGDLDNFYKIKLRTLGYRLVYEVIDHKLVVLVIAVGKRNQDSVYIKAESRK